MIKSLSYKQDKVGSHYPPLAHKLSPLTYPNLKLSRHWP